jgi:hypothetical protein
MDRLRPDIAGSRDAATATQVVIPANQVVRMIARPMIALVAAAALLLGFAPRPSAQESDLAAEVKATYVSKFAPFVQWPGPAAEFPDDVFPLCVADDAGGFVTVLQNTAKGQAFGGHNVVVRAVPAGTANPSCAEIYVAGSQSAILNTVRGKPILTITDAAISVDTRGIINFVIRENRVRFEIDEAAAATAGLVISSKLLSLAVSVHSSGR